MGIQIGRTSTYCVHGLGRERKLPSKSFHRHFVLINSADSYDETLKITKEENIASERSTNRNKGVVGC